MKRLTIMFLLVLTVMSVAAVASATGKPSTGVDPTGSTWMSVR